MALLKESQLRHNFGIEESKLKAIKCFLQGSVYCWIKNRSDEIFAARDLMGGEHFDWAGTPLMCLYEKHIPHKDNQSAIKEAGKDLGWILKSVLHEDKYTFETHDKGLTKGYKWIK